MIDPARDGRGARGAPGRTVLFWPLLAVVLLAPLPFAGVSPWAWATLACVTAALLAGWALLMAVGRAPVAVAPARVALPGVLLVCVLVWMALQMAPFTPAEWHHPIWAQAATALGRGLPGSITADRAATAEAMARLLWYAAVFWLALQLCRDRGTARRALGGLALAAALYAGYGLVIEFSGARMVLWEPKFAYFNNLTSTFINRNSYATYAGIGLIAMTAAIVQRFDRAGLGGGTMSSRLAAGIVFLFGHAWYLLLAWAVVVTALLLTDSRAGVVSGVIGLVVFLGAMGGARRRARAAYLWLLPVVLAALIGIFAISGDVVGARLARTLGGDDLRYAIYEVTIDGIAERPLLGTGAGTFAQAFARDRPPGFNARRAVRRAHNTYLENALELGIPAAAALTLAVALLALMCLNGVKRRRTDACYPALGFAASVLVGIHALVDFSLQIPAVGVTFAFVLGLACAQSWSRAEA